MKWLDPKNSPFKICGFAYFEKERIYRRLPINPSETVSEANDALANNTSGGQIRFHAVMKTFKIKVKLGSSYDEPSPHTPAITRLSFDFYAREADEGYNYIGTANKNGERLLTDADKEYEYTFVNGDTPIDVDVLLNFPLYGSVDEILIGVDDEAVITEEKDGFTDDKRLLVYGGSIEQGASSSRPGMSASNQLSRRLNREVINMGFSGSALAEPGIARILSDIERVNAFIISTEGNCPTAEWLDEKLRAFIEIYRSKHRTTPIIILPFAACRRDTLLPEKAGIRRKKELVQIKIVEDLRASGDENIYLVSQNEIWQRELADGKGYFECFTDGIHKTDLGCYVTAKALHHFLEDIKAF